MDGKDMNASAVRIMMDSAVPRKYPAISPRGMPISTEMIVEVIPTNREMRPPYKSLANRSRPTSSVPRIWASDGGLLNPAARSVVYGSKSVKKGDKHHC